MSPSKLQPALAGGAFIGVLSALPILQAGNCCCCLWIISGGLIAAWLMQQNHPRPVTVGDGALVGFFAGIVGAVVWAIVSVPVQLATSPMQARWIERLMDRAQDMPENVRLALEAMRDREMGVIGLVLGFLLWLILGMIFATIGGMLGAVFFKKNEPPPGTVDILPPA
jgi:uncharacterized protein YqgC (DUF456 family)